MLRTLLATRKFPKYVWCFALLCMVNIIALLVFLPMVNKYNDKTLANTNPPYKKRLPIQRIFASKTVVPRSVNSSCPTDLTIHPNGTLKYIADGTVCQPHVPPEQACQYTKTMFKLIPGIEKCKNQAEPPYELCSFREGKNYEATSAKLSFKCNFSICDWTKEIAIELLDPATGKMKKVVISRDVKNTTESIVKDLAEKTREDGFPFLFLKCTGLKNRKVVAQLLTFLPSLPTLTDKSTSEKINVNLILMDSVSRQHFYRSLPKTVDYLRSVQTDPNFNAHVFEYELFQAVDRYTQENERALFDGILFPGKTMSRLRKDWSNIHYDVLFAVFKRFGYQTMFLDDLCWQGIYGIMTKYQVKDWSTLQAKIKQYGTIDTTAFTEASCAIFARVKEIRRYNPFQVTKNHQICFNGKHHHQYLFEYIERYLDAIHQTPQSKPLFGYTTTHVNHDSRALRLQSIDIDLKEFIRAMATKENTITIIFADHGNTYTKYQTEQHEGRLETYHPAMLIVLPKGVGGKLGEEVVTNLRNNQHRLFNLFDVRDGLVELASYDGKTTMHPKGIFAPISKSRTCDDLTISNSALCICQNWEVEVANSTEQMALAEFAIGEINNKIQDSLVKIRKKGNALIGTRIVFGACQRLRIQEIENVRTRRSQLGIRTTTIDVTVQSDKLLKTRELFTVQVEFNEMATFAPDMRLASYSRISPYGPYTKCVDKGVDVKLCICEKTDTTIKSLQDVVGKDADITKLHDCVYAVRRSHDNNDVILVTIYEVANICDGENLLEVSLESTVNNIAFSRKLPATLTLAPRTIYFVGIAKARKKEYPTKLPFRWKIK